MRVYIIVFLLMNFVRRDASDKYDKLDATDIWNM
jgi:hypothetical protein